MASQSPDASTTTEMVKIPDSTSEQVGLKTTVKRKKPVRKVKKPKASHTEELAEKPESEKEISESVDDSSDEPESAEAESDDEIDDDARAECDEWTKEHKKHETRGRLKKTLLKLMAVTVAVIVITSVVFVYIYYETFDYDGDGILDWNDNDDDGDGIPDSWEKSNDFNPRNSDDANKDADSDNLTNKMEYRYDTDPHNADSDGDGLLDGAEIDHRTDPLNDDDDSDGLPDGWEVQYGLDPKDQADALMDTDKDGYSYHLYGTFIYENYTNIQEYQNGTNPIDNDTDGDRMYDGWEMHFNLEIAELKLEFPAYNFSFDPLDPTDGSPDIDVDDHYNIIGDGLTNTDEFLSDTDPLSPDSDGDGLTDGEEVTIYKTDPNYYDTDDDLLPDDWEVLYLLNPLSNDSDGDSIKDYQEDEDDDDLSNHREYVEGTHPYMSDTDGDSMPDGWEIKHGLNPNENDKQADYDNDSLSNFLEKTYGTDPYDPDSDNDTLYDGEEAVIGWYGILIDGVYITNSSAPRYYTDPKSDDSDNDGVKDYEEIYKWHSNATNNDTDNDGLSDYKELFEVHFNASRADMDSDGLNDTDEHYGTYGYYTFAYDPDTDEDGLIDGEEIFTDFYPGIDFDKTDNNDIDGTNPTKADTDEDGLPDGWEAQFGKTTNYSLIERYDATLLTIADPDDDGVVEIPVWLVNPLNKYDANQDPDHDSYNDYKYTNFEEYNYSKNYKKPDVYTDPLNWDSDKDGMSDGWESYFGYKKEFITPDPMDGSDAEDDPHHDGVHYYINGIQYYDDFTNLEEYSWGIDLDGDGIIDTGTTDPNKPDTDANGKGDYEEIWFADHDHDGLFTGWELIFNGTITDGYIPHYSGGAEKYLGKFNPFSNNSDGIGLPDGDEDPDGDDINNSKEQGDVNVTNGGSTDPTDETSARSSSSRAVGSDKTDRAVEYQLYETNLKTKSNNGLCVNNRIFHRFTANPKYLLFIQ